MTLAAFENYVASHVANAEQEVKDAFTKVCDFVRGEEVRIAAEIDAAIALLEGKGYLVQVPATPTAPV